ncbi:biotin/lipoyl-containing protein [Paraburkholderia rhynchosiae]|uniref:Lipoyl-binding domain-containing protein n=1 Tax=Paraburkholderia rhynchosiae TaxID=487049 RepID=A0A2N7VR54_9BURK|nr:biotin/lipoyl-containing protein [Paraburkholderia rhynchosiae]PMS19617.1 hypothetical protein C0Z16_35225 [Paraburkholderia rhynchosiae]CAB3742510.1 hypothetical protein LMG27174_06875 [Paraburkholderia rhynchosiae]
MTEKIEVDVGELRQITSWLAAVDIGFIEISKPGATVRLTMEHEPRAAGENMQTQTGRASALAEYASAPSASVGAQSVDVLASSAGIFLTTHPTRSTALVSAGAHVNAGDIVGLLRIALLCVPVVAPVAGVVVRTLAAHGATVGYGTRLIELAPSA